MECGLNAISRIFFAPGEMMLDIHICRSRCRVSFGSANEAYTVHEYSEASFFASGFKEHNVRRVHQFGNVKPCYDFASPVESSTKRCRVNCHAAESSLSIASASIFDCLISGILQSLSRRKLLQKDCHFSRSTHCGAWIT